MPPGEGILKNLSTPLGFGKLLRDARVRAGLSQTTLGQRCGVAKPTLSRYENGHVLPSLATFLRLALALSVDPMSLIDFSKL